MGMCYEYKQDLENAKLCYQKSLEIKPSYRESKLRLSKLASEPRAEVVGVTNPAPTPTSSSSS